MLSEPKVWSRRVSFSQRRCLECIQVHEWLESQPNATEVPSKGLELSGGYREGATKSHVYTLRSGIKT